MNENKYYIPTIQEFHIGFEYEWKPEDEGDYGYCRDRIDLEEYQSSLYEKITGDFDIRVKYLDKEDIESFGFEQIKEPDSGTFLLFKLNDKNNTTITLCTSDDWRCLIQNDCKMFMDIIIKNKSELKTLLKQLGIYNERK